MSNLWTFVDEKYVTEASLLGKAAVSCPKCQQVLEEKHRTGIDYDASGEDVLGVRYKHDCGADILIIND